jgi:predicted RNase H-like nuclease (RuvC/YqgF family)
VPIPVVSQSARGGPSATGPLGAPTNVADELRRAHGRIQELELRVASLLEQGAQMTEARTRIAKLESELNEANKPDAEKARLRREVAEQGERITELQQLWMSQEKEAREAAARAQQAEQAQARLHAAVEEMLHTYHASEAAAAQQRLHDLKTRVQTLLESAGLTR